MQASTFEAVAQPADFDFGDTVREAVVQVAEKVPKNLIFFNNIFGINQKNIFLLLLQNLELQVGASGEQIGRGPYRYNWSVYELERP
jgi:hypothetical protein